MSLPRVLKRLATSNTTVSAQGEGQGSDIAYSTPTEVKDADNMNMSETNLSHDLQQTTVFKDQADMYSLDLAAERDPTYNDGEDITTPLAEFLARPVQIYQNTWTVGYQTSNLDVSFDPWVRWQSDNRVKAKLENFAYASFDLKLRVMINGSPFQYGKAMMIYIPYGSEVENATIDPRDYDNQTAAVVQNWYMTGATGRVETTYQHFSTYPHVMLDPSTNQVQEFTLPFMWHNNYIAVNGKGSISKESLGVIRIYDLNPLRIANTSAPTSCQFTVYAWAENLKLHTPTDFVPASSKGGYKGANDEYNDGPVSSVASAVASASGKLSKVPVIGKFARASEIGAGAIGDVARLFGFSAPAMVENPDRYLPRNHGRLANIQGEDSSAKLSLDPKQEITVDPRTVGVMAEDEMAIKSIVTREQFLARCEWRGLYGQFAADGDENVKKLIFASLVSPNQIHRTGEGTGHGNQKWEAVQDTPGGFVANMFDHWRGSITYRVQVVCTKMHAGRLKLQFDPFVRNLARTKGDFNTTDINTRHTIMLDLAQGNEVEFTIPYVHYRPWLQCLNNDDHSTFQPYRTDQTAFTLESVYNEEVHMGIFTVSVVNELVAPIQTDADASATHAPVQVNIFFKCGEDMQFAMPSEKNSRWSTMNYIPVSSPGGFQSPAESTEVTSIDLFGVHDNPEGPKVFFGERVVSLRALVKRYGVVFTGKKENGFNNGNVWATKRNVPHTNATVMRDKARRHSYLSYLMPAFTCARGATRYKFNYIQTTEQGHSGTQQALQVERFGNRGDVSTFPTTDQLSLTSADSGTITDFMLEGYNGAGFINMSQNATLEVELPFYSNTRFMLACNTVNVDNDSTETIKLNPAMSQVIYAQLLSIGRSQPNDIVQHWFSAGDDFSLHFFLGVPQVFYHKGAAA